MRITSPTVFRLLALLFFAAFISSASSQSKYDKRQASISCALTDDGVGAVCDYLIARKFNLKGLSVELNKKDLNLREESFLPYPRSGQSTAVLIMVDTSDPKRKRLVDVNVRNYISNLIKQKQNYHKVSLATFSRDLKSLTPFVSDYKLLEDAVASIKSDGHSTELFKSILTGISLLEKENADRKGLIVISDGKSEDTAYGMKEVIDAATKSNIIILGVGTLLQPSESPWLQNLSKISEQSFGDFGIVNSVGALENSRSKYFEFLDFGGYFSFPLDANDFKPQMISLNAVSINNESLLLETSLRIKDIRPWWKQTLDVTRENWKLVFMIFGGVLILVGLGVYLLHSKRSQVRKNSQPGIQAKLSDLATGNLYEISGSTCRIGRDNSSNIKLLDDSVSQNHAEIHRRREGVFYIVDLSSTNGTFINGKRVSQAQLNSGDVIEVGKTRLKFFPG